MPARPERHRDERFPSRETISACLAPLGLLVHRRFDLELAVEIVLADASAALDVETELTQKHFFQSFQPFQQLGARQEPSTERVNELQLQD